MTLIIKFMKLDYTKRATEPIQTQANLPNYAEALRQLKQADALIEKKKKQLRVQAMKAHRGSWIDQEAEHRARLKKETQESNQKLLNEFQTLRTKQLQFLKQLRKKSEISKHESFKNRQRSRIQALEYKIKLNQQVRLKSQQHGQRIKKYYLEQIEMKKSRCLEKYNSKKMSRVNIDNFQQSRISQLKNFKSKQRDDLLQRLKIRQQELSKLDQSNSVQNTSLTRKEPSTSDFKSISGTELPYKDSNSSYIKKRKKCTSESKIDSNKRQLMILS